MIPLNQLGHPDLQALVSLAGGYDQITPEQWEEFDKIRMRVYESLPTTRFKRLMGKRSWMRGYWGYG